MTLELNRNKKTMSMLSYMGNATEKKLIVKNRLLETQIRNIDYVDPSVKHEIQDVKKNRKYTNLVLSGGAVKGYALVGVLEYLETHHYLNNIRNIACSSVGSIFAVLYAVGYTVSEIKQIAENMDPCQLAGVDKNLVSDIFHVATEYGLNNGQHLIDTISDLIEKRTGNRHYTLEQLWKEKGINLVVTGTDITTGKTIYFWHGKYPRMPLRLLVRITCSLPELFCPVVFDGHYLVDGGLLDNTPIHVFDGPTPGDSAAGLNMTPPNPGTLAIIFIGDLSPDSTPSTQGDIGLHGSGQSIQHKINSYRSFNFALIDSLLDNGVKRYMRPSFWLRTIPVHVPAYPIYHFKLTKADIRGLFVYGAESTRNFFESD
jgi:predicted acylesterase/phospholipase RssA